ncbi:MAG TPA: hypothetical protein VFI82_01630 [Terriglobales bacterium]|jgi:hypothetical protein|nr:hypothetical protein [Terriglobales bacterium]
MATKKSSATTAKEKSTRKRPAAKKSRQRATATSASTQAAGQPANRDRLTEVAKTIGSTVGDIVAKTKKVLHR